jgi:hypothetical protein
MVAPVVASLIVTICAAGYVPGATENVGVAAAGVGTGVGAGTGVGTGVVGALWLEQPARIRTKHGSNTVAKRMVKTQDQRNLRDFALT